VTGSHVSASRQSWQSRLIPCHGVRGGLPSKLNKHAHWATPGLAGVNPTWSMLACQGIEVNQGGDEVLH
jgi:hypothetical protein